MLRTKICSSICSNIIRNNKFRYLLGPRELKYQCRFLASGKEGGPKKGSCDTSGKKGPTGKKADPCDDTSEPPPASCKGMGGRPMGKPSLMDKLPKPVAGCSWEEQQKKLRVRQGLTLLLGCIVFALSAYTLSIVASGPKTVFPPKRKVVEKKKEKKPVPVVRIPEKACEIPDEVQYLLVGGGTASFSAFRAIKSRCPKAQVLVVGNEPYYPYMRPPLTKELFYAEDRDVAKKLNFKQWNGRERSLYYEPDDFYSRCLDLKEVENGGVAVARGWTVTKIDPVKRIAYLDKEDKTIKYDKCLIATGAKPKNHPLFEELSKETSDKVTLYRNIHDFLDLEEIIANGAKDIVVVGGSFLGSELACSIARRGRKEDLHVTQVFRESGNMGKILPEYLCKWTTGKVRDEGVNVMTNTTIEDIELKKDKLVLILSDGKEIAADHVVVALGVKPNTDLATTSLLETDKDLGGFLVNAELEARSNLYVAGDCACFYDAKLGRRRVEHHDHAVVSGRLAGENMTGAGKPYSHQSMFWSDLGPDVGFEAIGIVDSSLPTVGVYLKTDKEDDTPKDAIVNPEDGGRESDEQPENESNGVVEGGEQKKKEELDEPIENYGKGVIFYLRDDIVIGIVLWNIFNRMSIARQVLNENKRYADLNEVAKLFNIHKD